MDTMEAAAVIIQFCVRRNALSTSLRHSVIVYSKLGSHMTLALHLVSSPLLSSPARSQAYGQAGSGLHL